jgi:hypothetical protein
MKIILTTLIVILTSAIGYSQNNIKNEILMETYSLDTLANAVVLYENANLYLDEEHNFKFRTDYYFRIKLFNENAFDIASINIPHYKEEKIIDVKAASYNLEKDEVVKTTLNQKDVYLTRGVDFWKETKFTIPNVKEGSVIEYSYSLISPYSQLDDWQFQSDIPKIKSEYDASILGNYEYNLRLFGFKNLSKREQSTKRHCLEIPGVGSGGCNIYSFSMDSIPAFVEEEYMLSKRNYMSRLVFDLISFTNIYGGTKNYTNTWEKTDETLKKYFLDDQTDKENFFRRRIPEDITYTEDDLARAKKVYSYIQKKLSWNGRNRTSGKLKIKDVYKNGSGSADAINLILFNSLKAVNIEANLVASSTRNNGLPTKIYPNSKDFNYTLVRVNINDKTYFLDATNNKLVFGQLPVKCINGEGRVLYPDKESTWEEIKTDIPTYEKIDITLKLNENNTLSGKLNITKDGYFSLYERKIIENKTNEEYIEYFQNKVESIGIQEYSVENASELEKPLEQSFNIILDEEMGSSLILNPFLFKKVEQNPFKLEERNYPVDYGYARTYIYSIEFTLPENYSIVGLPESAKIRLPDLGGSYILNTSHDNNKVTLFSKLTLNKRIYSPREYKYFQSPVYRYIMP